MKISVISPVYNVAPYLDETIASVLAQEFSDFEYLIVDDGSSDGTRAIAEAATRRDSRVRLIALRHGGSSAARNAGLAEARTEWVSFIDGDDRWEPGFLRTLFAAATSARAGIVGAFCWSQIIDAEGTSTGLSQTAPLPVYGAWEMLREQCPPGNGSCLLLRRDALREAGGFDVTLESGQDSEMWHRLLARDAEAYFLRVPEKLTHYRKGRPGSLTCTAFAKRLKTREIINQRYTRHFPASRRVQVYLSQATYAATHDYRRNALRTVLTAMRESPTRTFRSRKFWAVIAKVVLGRNVTSLIVDRLKKLSAVFFERPTQERGHLPGRVA